MLTSTLPLTRGFSDRPKPTRRKPSIIAEEGPEDLNEVDDDSANEFDNPLTSLLKARNRCKQYSTLYNALNSLHEATKELSYRVIEQLGEHANLLIDNLENPDLIDKTTSIESFLLESKKTLGDKYSRFKDNLKSVAIAMTLLALAITIAAAVHLGVVGCLFLATVLLVTAAQYLGTLTLLAGSLMLGAGVLAYNSHRLFPPLPGVDATNIVAEVAAHDGVELASS